MNLLLDIEKDADCVNIQQANMDSVMQYVKGLGEGPTGTPFHPFFEKVDCKWNHELPLQFKVKFKHRYPQLCATDDDEDWIYKLFFQHLIHLKKFMDSTKPHPGESEARRVQRVSRQ
ncbi:hypothetical protein BDQ17DRAFT_1438468 [Cyathus striatus]|nr:hypothetical protein BDQ17DRAFT_1438468 [Cyathus striatus]